VDPFFERFGWCMVAVASIFALGLVPRLASRFYRGSPGFARRLAAPVIFSVLAAACFLGIGGELLILVAVLGLTQIIMSRRRKRRAAAPVA
jgi:hypothetical protein